MTRITVPPPTKGKRGGWHHKALKSYPADKRKLWLHGRAYDVPQRPQSPIRTWADMSLDEREAIQNRLR